MNRHAEIAIATKTSTYDENPNKISNDNRSNPDLTYFEVLSTY